MMRIFKKKRKKQERFIEGQRVRCIKGGRGGSGWRLHRIFVIGKAEYWEDDIVGVLWPNEGGSGIFSDSVEIHNQWKGAPR